MTQIQDLRILATLLAILGMPLGQANADDITAAPTTTSPSVGAPAASTPHPEDQPDQPDQPNQPDPAERAAPRATTDDTPTTAIGSPPQEPNSAVEPERQPEVAPAASTTSTPHAPMPPSATVHEDNNLVPTSKRDESTLDSSKHWHPQVSLSVDDEGWFAIRATTGVSFRSGRSFDLYTTDNSLRVRGAAVQVDIWRPDSTWALGVDAEWMFEKASSEGLLGGGYDSYYTHHQARLGPTLRYRGLGLIVPQLRGFGVLAVTKQRLNDTRRHEDYVTKYQPTGGAGLALGVRLRTPSLRLFQNPSFPTLSLGLLLEISYAAVGGAEFRLESEPDGGNAIPIQGTSLGDLQLGGAAFQAGFELRM